MSGEIEVVYRIRMDRAKLDEYVRGLYDGPPDDPCPEPDPGLDIVHGWVAEARGYMEDGNSVDTIWWNDERYTKGITIEVIEINEINE